MKVILYSNISFSEFVDKCEVLRDQFDGFLTPFFDVEAIKAWKNVVYSLNFPYWKRDLIWEFLNDDIEFDELQRVAKRTN